MVIGITFEDGRQGLSMLASGPEDEVGPDSFSDLLVGAFDAIEQAQGRMDSESALREVCDILQDKKGLEFVKVAKLPEGVLSHHYDVLVEDSYEFYWDFFVDGKEYDEAQEPAMTTDVPEDAS